MTAGGRQLIAPKDIPQNNVITAIHAGGNLIVIGDNNGLVTLLDAHGDVIYGLCDGRDKGPAEFETTPLIDLPPEAYKNKVNQVLRVGRWVVASLDNGRIELYDIFTERAPEPVDAYLNPGASGGGGGVNGSGAREITVFDKRVVALYAATRDAKGRGKIKPDVLCWAPRTAHESFEFFAGLPTATWIDSPLKVVAESMGANARALSTRDEFADHCAKLRESVVRLEEFDALQTKADAALPFQFVQDLQANCDNYARALRKINKGTKIFRHKDALDTAARNFYSSLEMIAVITDYVGEIKSSYTSCATSRMVPAFNSSADFSDDGTGADGAGGQDAQLQGGQTAAAAGGPSSRSRDEGDAKIEAMLGEVISGLCTLKTRTAVALEDYDATCEAGINDPDLIMPLLDVYTRLRQFNEDLKETALEAAMLKKDDIRGQWYAEGGIYDDEKIDGTVDEK